MRRSTNSSRPTLPPSRPRHSGAFSNGASKLTNGFGVGARVADTLPLYLGVNFGFNYIGSEPDLGFQILPTVTYRYETGAKQVIYPYVGISAGLHLVPGNELFELLLRPGAEISLTRSFGLAIESTFGVTDASFSFLPALNAVFKI